LAYPCGGRGGLNSRIAPRTELRRRAPRTARWRTPRTTPPRSPRQRRTPFDDPATAHTHVRSEHARAFHVLVRPPHLAAREGAAVAGQGEHGGRGRHQNCHSGAARCKGDGRARGNPPPPPTTITTSPHPRTHIRRPRRQMHRRRSMLPCTAVEHRAHDTLLATADRSRPTCRDEIASRSPRGRRAHPCHCSSSSDHSATVTAQLSRSGRYLARLRNRRLRPCCCPEYE
jgi:hypothetical protein